MKNIAFKIKAIFLKIKDSYSYKKLLIIISLIMLISYNFFLYRQIKELDYKIAVLDNQQSNLETGLYDCSHRLDKVERIIEVTESLALSLHSETAELRSNTDKQSRNEFFRQMKQDEQEQDIKELKRAAENMERENFYNRIRY